MHFNDLNKLLNKRENKKTYTHLSDLMRFVNTYEEQLNEEVIHCFLDKISSYTAYFNVDNSDLNPNVFKIKLDK